MAEKVVFYPLTKTIKINSGVTTVDFQTDIYSDGKEDWLSTTYNKFIFPIISIGGNVVTGGKVMEPTFFLRNGWQIEPASEDHEITIYGNIYHADNIPIVKIPTGTYKITVNLSTTTSPDKQESASSMTEDTITAAIMNEIIEGTLSLKEVVKIIASVLAGKTSGGGTTTLTFRDILDTKDRVIATVDDNSNRTEIILDGE